MKFRDLVKNKKGFSLIELLVAVGVFMIIVSSVAVFSVDAFRGLRNVQNRLKASLYTQEVINGIALIKNDSWTTILNNTNMGAMHLSFGSNKYSIVSGTDIKDGVTYSFTIESVYRDSSNNIVAQGTAGATLDTHTRLIRTSATWVDIGGQNQTSTSTSYVNDWKTKKWFQTTSTEFNRGTQNNTFVTSTSGGEVTLGTIVYADWCKPSLTLTAYDMPGQGIANAVTATPGKIYSGTGSNASGLSFINLDVTSANPPVATLVSTYNGYKTNGVFGEPGYIYLATDTNSKEIVVIQISSSPNTEVGYFDSPGSTNGEAITVSNNKGYMSASSKLHIFDLTSKTGARSELGTGITLAGSAKKIVINGNYAYIAIDSSTTQLQVVDISNPLSLSIVASVQTSTVDKGVDVFVNSTGTRAYLATTSSATKPEMLIINTTTKSGNLPIISSFDTAGMAPTGVTVVPNNRAIIVGTGGTQQYQVIDTTTETSLTKCGGLAVSTGVNGVASIDNFNGNSYSYIVTGDSSAELKIVQGGPGGGIGNGYGYPPTGSFTSEVFDTTSASTQFNVIQWGKQSPSGSTLKFQVRTGTSSDLSAATWTGPDGTSSTYFTTSTGEYLPSSLQSKRYIQYKAFFTSDTANTAILEDVTINYEN